MYNNAFADMDQLHLLLSAMRFKAQVVTQLDEIPRLVSVDRLNPPVELMQQSKPGLRLWVLETAAA